MGILYFLVFSALLAGAIAGDDSACTSQPGFCQDDALYCSSSYTSGLCSGNVNIRCCIPPAGDIQCTTVGGICKANSLNCDGAYQSGLCSGASNILCCIPPNPDQACSDISGVCQNLTLPCTGSYQCGLCSGPSDIRCCAPTPDPDPQCTAQSGVCQDSNSVTCNGGYQSGLCSGPSNIKCCLPGVDPDPQCTAVFGTCQDDDPSTCDGVYQTGLCNGLTNIRCCVPDLCLTPPEMIALQDKLIEFECIRYEAYDAQPTNSYVDWTICVGFNLKRGDAQSVFQTVLPWIDFNAVYAGTTSLSHAQCLALFEYDLTETYIPRAENVAGSLFCTFPTNVKIALVNAVYRGDLAYSHTTAQYIRAGNWCPVPAEYLNYGQYINCIPLGIPGVCSRMDWNAEQFATMC